MTTPPSHPRPGQPQQPAPAHNRPYPPPSHFPPAQPYTATTGPYPQPGEAGLPHGGYLGQPLSAGAPPTGLAPAPQSRWRSPKFLVPAGIVAALAVLGAFQVNTMIQDGTFGVALPASERSYCGLAPLKLKGTLPAAPGGVAWEKQGSYGITHLPKIGGQGPGKVDSDGVRSCFAHTPTGALLAAATMGGTDPRDPAARRHLLERLALPGASRDAAVRRTYERTEDYRTPGLHARFSGFRMLAYDGKRAEVELAVETNQALAPYITVSLPLVWSGGDWRSEVGEEDFGRSTGLLRMPPSGFVTWDSPRL